MKASFQILLLTFALTVLFIRCEKEPEINPNASVEIPDPNFLAALIEVGVDTNEDGQISNAEAGAIIALDVSENNISDMTGIEKFIHLDTLNCAFNQLTVLDLSGNTDLDWLFCYDNQLTWLDVTGNTELIWLVCAWNQLTNLDVSKNTALESLECYSNPLNTLDVSNNTALGHLGCTYNQITILDVSNLSELKILNCDDNQLNELDLSNNFSIGEDFFYRAATDADLSIRNMPTLEEVCVWTMPFPPEGFRLDTTGNPNVYFTSECSR